MKAAALRSFFVGALALASGAALWGCRTAGAPATPASLQTVSDAVYVCRYVPDRGMAIDGAGDEKAWRAAHIATDFSVPGAQPQPAAMRSEARLLWSDKFLYLFFRCSTDAIRSTLTARDAELFNSETAEIYLCPNGSAQPYYEIDFNPQNAIYDTLIDDYHYEQLSRHWKEWAQKYNAAIRSATRVEKHANGSVSGWTLEAAIPMADLRLAAHSPPHPGDTWLFNLCRIADGGGGKVENSCWVPTGADFHRPYEFPRLMFVGK